MNDCSASLSPASADPHVKDRVESSRSTLDFNVKAIEGVRLDGPPALTARDLMSPFVWQERDGRFGITVRAVTKPGETKTDTGVIWAGWSDGSRSFTMLDQPVISPGPDAHDAGGIEDPTVVWRADGSYAVYYTGVLADMAHSELCYATGLSVDRLTKSGTALASSKSEGNTKEATVDRSADGQWHLFFE